MTLSIRPIAPQDEADWRSLWTAYLEFYESHVSEEVYKTTFARLCAPEVTDQNGLLALDGETPVGGVMKVKPLPDGPLVITGSVEVIAGSGRRLAAGDRHVLCRCGHSKNKPFCDGSHAEVGFEAP